MSSYYVACAAWSAAGGVAGWFAHSAVYARRNQRGH